MAKRYKFTVASCMPFPIDMLRYDGCYPVDTESATQISASIRREAEKPETYRVTLISDRPPTDGRWSSFCWRVESISRV